MSYNNESKITHVIESVTFGILSPDEIKRMAVCEINNTKLNGLNSVYDDRMGTLTEQPCGTCGYGSKECPGHFGYIEFVEPILSPLFSKVISLFLKCFCKQCYKLLISADYFSLNGISALTEERRFKKVLKNLEEIDICTHCEAPQPSVGFIKKEGLITLEYKQKSKKESVKIALTAEDIFKIFDNIKDDCCQILGFNPELIHPKNFIMKVFPVVPPCTRPYIIADGNVCDDDFTIQILKIVKINQKLGKLDSSEKDYEKKHQKLLSSLEYHVKTFYEDPTGTLKCMKQRLSSKDGQLRQNQMGKRVNFSGRTVIGPDPTLKVTQVGIPELMAKVLTFPEPVTSFNIDRLSKLVENNQATCVIRYDEKKKRDVYHNLKYALFETGTELLYDDIIVKNRNVKNFDNLQPEDYIRVKIGNEPFNQGDRLVRNGKLVKDAKCRRRKKFEIKIGDVVERHIQDGDFCLMNRQPTLHQGSMIAKEVVVKPYKTIRLNLATTSSFNADFDGDEMNIHVPQSYKTVAELRHLSSTDNFLISAQESKPNIRIVQDSLLASYRMTKGTVKISKNDFFNISNKGTSSLWSMDRIDEIKKVFQKFGKKERLFSGHGLVSLILPRDFYYTRKNDGNPDEPEIKIYKGVMYEGTLNKAILGSAHGSLIQVLHKDYGKAVTCDFVNNIQFLANAWVLKTGFSIGLEDCMCTSENQVKTIKQTLTGCYIKAEGVEQSTQNSGIREVRVTATLSQAKDVGMKIAKEAMRKDNNFLDTVGSGSKGDYFNIAQLTGLLGQQNINSQRVKSQLNHGKRTLPHYPFEGLSKETEYESRGFVAHSFIRGLSPEEFFFHAMSGREGICDTAMKTADSGYLQRRIVKVSEDIQVKYDGTVRDGSGNIYQLAYGQNALNPIHTIKVGDSMEICDVGRIIDRLSNK